jgi:hypothetical protein
MSGTMTFSYDEGIDASQARPGLRKVTALITSDASAGTASGTTAKIVGRLVKVKTVPGSPAPTTGWTLTITDGDSFDVTTNCDANMSANQSNVNTVETYLFVKNHAGTPLAMAVHPVVCEPLTLAVSSAGNSKQATIELYYEPLK